MAAPDDHDPELAAYPAPTGSTRTRHASTPWFGAAVAVLVFAVLGTAVLSRRSPGATTGTTTSTAPAPMSTLAVQPGAPTDGKATRRLPVRLTPDKDLVDGQVVGVHGSGFRPGHDVGIVQCTGAAQWQGSDACDIMTYALSTPDANGEVQGMVKIRRYFTVGNQTVDCMNGNVDPDDWADYVRANGDRTPNYDPSAFTCIIAIGEMGDYDWSGGWPFALRGATFVPTPRVPAAGDLPAPSPVPSSVVAPEAPTTLPAPGADSPCPLPNPTFPPPPSAPGTTAPPLPGTTPTTAGPTPADKACTAARL